MHPSKRAHIAHLKVDKAPAKVHSKYINFRNVFLPKLAIKLPKYMRSNNHAIKIVDNQQLFYSFIYSLSLIKLEILKIYIKNNLVNSFIKPSKFLARTLIFFNKKSDGSLKLCVNYQGFNNLTIINCYSSFLVEKSLN